MEEVSALLLSEMEKKMSPKRTLQAIASSISRFEQPWGIKSRTFREEKPRPLSYVSSADRKTNACCGGGLRKVGRLDRGFHSRNSSYPPLSQASSSIDVYRKGEAAFFECLDILPKKTTFLLFSSHHFLFLIPSGRRTWLTPVGKIRKEKRERLNFNPFRSAFFEWGATAATVRPSALCNPDFRNLHNPT